MEHTCSLLNYSWSTLRHDIHGKVTKLLLHFLLVAELYGHKVKIWGDKSDWTVPFQAHYSCLEGFKIVSTPQVHKRFLPSCSMSPPFPPSSLVGCSIHIQQPSENALEGARMIHSPLPRSLSLSRLLTSPSLAYSPLRWELEHAKSNLLICIVNARLETMFIGRYEKWRNMICLTDHWS